MYHEIEQSGNYKINHAETLRFLQKQGYSMRVIRHIFPFLVGVDSYDMARVIGTSRQNVSHHLVMLPKRRNPAIQAGIATMLQVPKEEFFVEDGDERPDEVRVSEEGSAGCPG